ncbi:MAG: D-tyrosyl-tRNA(Tyr) deacylase [Thiobacillus sp.]|nr:D-tyrosyl-tRNA(Tyr) deacylase [Thiobacillus sp.]
MIGLLQRVSRASVEVGGRQVASIGRGLLVLVGVQPADTEAEADQLLARLLDYRVFPDANDRMNLSLRDIDGGLLLVPQFTLAADTSRGRRPSFTSAAPPALGARLFDYLATRARAQRAEVGSGVFGADMQVALVNDGPVTFWLEIPPALS